MKAKKKVKLKKTWTIVETTYEDGSKWLKRTNDGFNGLEMLGIASLASLEITALFSNQEEYDVIRRVTKVKEK